MNSEELINKILEIKDLKKNCINRQEYSNAATLRDQEKHYLNIFHNLVDERTKESWLLSVNTHHHIDDLFDFYLKNKYNFNLSIAYQNNESMYSQFNRIRRNNKLEDLGL